MKKNKGFGLIGILIIVIAVLVVGDIAYNAVKNSAPSASQNTGTNNYQPQGNQGAVTNNPTVPAQNPISNPVNNFINNSASKVAMPVSPSVNACLPTTVPSITVTSPSGGEIYNGGQQVLVKWTSCNVSGNVYLGLAAGGHDSGLLSESPVPVTQGSYQWTVPVHETASNIYKIIIDTNTNPDIQGRSGVFSIQ